MGLFGDLSGFTGGAQPSAADKQAISGIDQTTGNRQAITLQQTTVIPVDGQSNDTPPALPDSETFQIDSYRNGNAGSDDNEQLHPLTLASNDEETFASMTLRAVDSSGNTNDLISAYSRFFLQAVSEAEQEKFQVYETFTGFYAFFYGKKPPIYRYTGLLLSDPNYRWNNDFKFVYENFFRGTSAVEFAAEVIMIYDGRVISGFPLNLSMQQEAANDKGVPFSMDLLVVRHDITSLSIDIGTQLQQIQKDLQAQRNKLLAAQKSLASGGPATNVADNATNGNTNPFSTGLPGASAGAAAVSQLGFH